MMEKRKREALERELEKLKEDLKAYIRLSPLLNVSEAEKERVINMLLDDILNRKKELENE
jgi:hypothetical protein